MHPRAGLICFQSLSSEQVTFATVTPNHPSATAELRLKQIMSRSSFGVAKRHFCMDGIIFCRQTAQQNAGSQ